MQGICAVNTYFALYVSHSASVPLQLIVEPTFMQPATQLLSFAWYSQSCTWQIMPLILFSVIFIYPFCKFDLF